MVEKFGLNKFLEAISLKRKGEKGLGEKGLTLIEILAVVVLIGLIILFLISRVNAAGDKTNELGVKTDLRNFQVAAEQVMRDTSAYKLDASGNEASLDDEDLNSLLDTGLQFETGKSKKLDPWGTAYQVEYYNADNGNVGTVNGSGYIQVTSLGKDKTISTDDILLATYYYEGMVSSCTSGFKGNKNLVADAFELTAGCGTNVQ